MDTGIKNKSRMTCKRMMVASPMRTAREKAEFV